MDVQDRGHCVSGILVVKRPIQQGCGQGEMLEAFMCLQQELNQDHASFALERHLEDPLGENWRRDVALHQTRRSVSKAADAHLGIDGGHRNGTLEGITPVTISGPAARWSPVYSPPMARPLKAEATPPKKTPEAQLWAAADQAALEFSHGHEDAQLKPSCWVVATGVNALRGADERDAHSLQLI